MRRALAMPLFRTQSAAEVTSLAPHGSKARLRVVTTRRGSWRSHVHRTRLRSACSSSSPAPTMAGSRGKAPCVLLGDLKGDILSRERMSPFARFPASGGENHSRFGPQKRRDHLSVVPNFLQLAEALRNDRRRVSGRQRTGVKVKIIPLRRAPGLVGVALVILAALLVHLAD